MFDCAIVCFIHFAMESKDADLKESPKKANKESKEEGRNDVHV